MARGVIWWDFDGTLVSRPVMWAEVALRLLEREAPDHRVTSEEMTALVFSGRTLDWRIQLTWRVSNGAAQ